MHDENKGDIILVNDDDNTLALLERILAMKGYHIRTAANGTDGLKLARIMPPELMILDVCMSDMDGLELCKKLKETPTCKDVPIIFISAANKPEDVIAGFKAGAIDYIAKPFYNEEVWARVSTHLKLYRLTLHLKEIQKNLAERVADQTTRLKEEIEERKQAEEKAKQSQKKFQRLVENLENKYFFYSHGADGIFTYLSPSITSILGYSQEEFMLHYEDKLTDHPINKQVIAHSKLSLHGEKQSPYRLEIFHKNGFKRWLEVSERPIFDKDGRVIAVEGLANDVTKEQSASEEMRQTNKHLEKLFTTTHFCLVYLDKGFNFIRVNQAYADAGSYPIEYYIGKNHFDLYPNRENEAIFREVVKTGVPYTVQAKPFEYPDHPELGTTYWDWSLHPVKNSEGKVISLIFTLVDVTKAKRAELKLKTQQSQLEVIVDERTSELQNEIVERKQIENELRQNMEELERFSRLASGREQKMIQLKKEVNDLLIKLGQNAKYRIIK